MAHAECCAVGTAACPEPRFSVAGPILTATAEVAWILVVSVWLPRDSLLALSAVFFAATVSSIACFAFSAVAGGLLPHLVDGSVKVVMIMMFCSIGIQSLSVVLLWREIDWRRLGVFLLGGIFGLPVGVWLLLHLDPKELKSVLGALLLIYASSRVRKGTRPVRSSNGMWDVLTGWFGGVSGGVAGFPGAAGTIWCGMQVWPKRKQRAIYQPYILIMQVLGLMLIRVLHPAAAPAAGIAKDILPFVPAALLGALAGLAIFEHLSERSFKLAVNALLFVSGIGLLV